MAMTAKNKPLTSLQAWKALVTHQKNGIPHLRDLFVKDPERGEKMTAEAAGLFLDYSKNRMTDETFRLLLQLAKEAGLKERIKAMFRGEKSILPRTGLFCIPLCAHRWVHPLLLMV